MLGLPTGRRTPAFDQTRLAAALSEPADTGFDAGRLPFREIQLVDEERAVRVALRRGKKAAPCSRASTVATAAEPSRFANARAHQERDRADA